MRFRIVLWMLILSVFFLDPAAFPASFEIDVVRARIFDWRNAWQRRDIDAYMSFYSPSFHSGGLDYLGWGLKKTEIFKTTENISVGISDLWVLIEGNRALARFVQQYEQSSFRDVGEKVLILEKVNSTWKIVSEEWTPLNGYGKHHSGPAASETSGKTYERVPKISRSGHSGSTAGHQTRPVAVKNVDFEIHDQGERVFINLGYFFVPTVFNLEGERPRVVIDIMNVSTWEGKPRIPVNGRLVKQIRTYLHKDSNKLRVVLDLESSENYFITQTFHKKKNIYSIQVNKDP